MTEDNLKKAIENLSQKKHVINEGALRAKEDLDNPAGAANHTSHYLHKQQLMISLLRFLLIRVFPFFYLKLLFQKYCLFSSFITMGQPMVFCKISVFFY